MSITDPALEARVHMLELEVNDLQQTFAPDESLTANYLTVGAGGLINGFVFPEFFSPPTTITGLTVNTAAIAQSINGANPFSILNGLAFSPIIMVGFHTAGAWSDNQTGTTWQLTAGVNSSGNRQAIAIGSVAVGNHVWAMNPNLVVNNGGVGFVIEADANVETGNSAHATGILIANGGGGTNLSPAITILTTTSGWTNGIRFVSYQNTHSPVTAGSSLIVDDSVTAAAQFLNAQGSYGYVINAINAISTNACGWFVQNSGSAANSQALLLTPVGGFANAGNLVQIQSQDGSTAANGIVFHNSAFGVGVAAAGSLILDDGSTVSAMLDAAGNYARALNLETAVSTVAGITVAQNSGSAAQSEAIVVYTNGGFANPGNLIQLQSRDGVSTAGGGILFHFSAGVQAIATTGVLIWEDGGTYQWGIDFSRSTFNGAAIRLGFGSGGIAGATIGHGINIGTATNQLVGFYGVQGVPQAAAIPAPAGGATIDTQARTAIGLILAVLNTASGVGLTA